VRGHPYARRFTLMEVISRRHGGVDRSGTLTATHHVSIETIDVAGNRTGNWQRGAGLRDEGATCESEATRSSVSKVSVGRKCMSFLHVASVRGARSL
jgi:hypothetical protein